MKPSERARLTAAIGTGLFAHLAASYLFRGSWAAAALAGLVTGVAAGGVLRRPGSGAAASVASVLAVSLAAALAGSAGDAAAFGRAVLRLAPLALASSLTAAAAGSAAAWAFARRGRALELTTAAALALIVAGMWTTAWGAAHRDSVLGPSTSRQLTAIPDMTQQRDADLYIRITQLMREGEGYYSAAMTARQEASPEEPVESGGAVRFRLPTLFWLWAASPLPPPATFIGGLLAIGTAAVLAAYALGRTLAPPPIALASSACVAAAFAAAASRTTVAFSEWWAGALVLCSLAAWALHLSRDGDRTWLAAAAGLALAAALTRELAAFALVGGFGAAWLSDRRDGRRRKAAWALSLALFAAAYAAHFAVVGGGAMLGGGLEPASWLRSPLDRASVVLAEGDRWLLGTPLLSAVAAALAAAGLLAGRNRDARLATVLLPAAVFLLIGPSGSLAAGEPAVALGYWGGLVKPSLWALLPAAAGLLVPGRRRKGLGPTPRSSGA